MPAVIPLDLPSLLILATPSLLVLLFLYIALQYLTVKDVLSISELPSPPDLLSRLSPVGHLPQLLDPDLSPQTHERWYKTLGATYQITGFGPLDKRLFSLDPGVIKYVLDNPEKYQKGWQARAYVDQAVGEGGLVMAEGRVHRVMRRILQPVFSKKNLDALAPISSEKAKEMCSILRSLSSSSSSSPASAAVQVDVVPLLTRATFDVIGLAGFGYPFNALSRSRSFPTLGDGAKGKGKEEEKEEEADDPLYTAFQNLFASISGFTLRMYMGIYWPWLDERFPDKRVKTIRRSREVIDRAVKGWIKERQEEMQDERSQMERKDLLTLMIREIASAAPKTPMPDDLVIAQVNTFLMAGSETTALTLAWALYYLSQDRIVQRELRDECRRASGTGDLLHLHSDGNGHGEGEGEGGGEVPLDVIDRLPLLEKVVRETLRLTPAVHTTFRQAQEDDIIPLSPSSSLSSSSSGDGQPNSPTAVESPGSAQGRRGPIGISIRKGQYVHIPIEGLNTLRAVWGEDAHLWRPGRWDAIMTPASSSEKRGSMGSEGGRGTGWTGTGTGTGSQWRTWAGLMSFSTGPKGCIGMRFALIEIKMFLFHLVREFEFECSRRIVKRNAMVVRPIVDGENDLGQRLPLRIRRAA